MKTSSRNDRIGAVTKKTRLVGIREFIDSKTGEKVPMQITEVQDRDYNFHKIWLQNLVLSLEGIANQKLRLAFWIIDHLNKDGQLVMTQEMISEKSGIGIATVKRTMRLLQVGNMPFLQKINSGAYMVNPDVIWKGSHGSRMGICFEWAETAESNKAKDDSKTVVAGSTDTEVKEAS